jgi:hypothetical protein
LVTVFPKSVVPTSPVNLPGHNSIKLEAAKEIRLRFLRISKQPGLCGCQLFGIM